MVNIETCRKLALSFPDVTEQDHFGMPSFRFKKKIFMTIHTDKNIVMLKLSESDQSIFMAYDSEIIYPVKGYWGTQGATMFDLVRVKKIIFNNALKAAYNNVSVKKVASKKKVKD
ncbi:MAG: MmcQ/YjbR family DNA-binding protein [Bacteroidetes bacterium]|nr:MmcQ/YjbR family DNA-binding protein [Bacteroidota bacterium]